MRINSLAIVYFIIILITPLYAARIAYITDVHEDIEGLKNTLSQFKKQGITHIVGLGDYVDASLNETASKDPAQRLDELLSLIGPLSGVPKENVYLLPGNHEHSIGSEAFVAIAQKYSTDPQFTALHKGRLITIDGTTFHTSHIPFVPVGQHILPSPEKIDYLTRTKMGRLEELPPEADFGVFGHVHQTGIDYDSSGKALISAGVITGSHQEYKDFRTYSIVDTKTRSIEFFKEDAQLLKTLPLPKSIILKEPPSCERWFLGLLIKNLSIQ